MESSYKDPELKGLYVRRCKCGKRPQYDRIDPCSDMGSWIVCVCGREGESGSDKDAAIKNWNDGKFIYLHSW